MSGLIVAAVAVGALLLGAAIAWWLTRERLNAQIQVLLERDRHHEARAEALVHDARQQQQRTDQQLATRERELAAAQQQARELDSKLAAADTQLREERKLWESKLALLEEAKEKLGDAFKAVSADVLKHSNQAFLTLAQETMTRFHAENRGDLEKREQAVQALVAPIAQSLDKVREQIGEVEKTRAQAYGSLTQYIGQMVQAQDKLRSETGNLVKALRAPQGRGRWGEIQLQRVVEMAGMVEHCDFQQQASRTTDDGKQRPDLLVRLPGGKYIVVDAKAPLSAYLDSLEAATDDVRQVKLHEHAAQVRTHLAKLGSKQYWQQFQPAPEFVVLFLPGESFFSAALQAEPTLIETGVNQQVVIATPTTLIALLKAVSYGWGQEKIRENSQQLKTAGTELYERVRTFAAHLTKLGGSLNSALDAYNGAMGSLETRLLVSARRFKELGASSGAELLEPELIHKRAREPQGHEAAVQTQSPLTFAPPLSAAAELEPADLPTAHLPNPADPEPEPFTPPAPVEPAPPAAPGPAPAQVEQVAREHSAVAELAKRMAHASAPVTAPDVPAAPADAFDDPLAAADPLGSLDDLTLSAAPDQSASIDEVMAALESAKPRPG